MILFKLNYWKQFLITLIVLGLYPLLAFIVSQILSLNSNTERLFQWLIFLFFVVSVVSLIVTSKKQTQFKPIYNLLNQVFFLTIIYMPMMVVYYLKSHTGIFYDNFYYNYRGASAKTVVNMYGQKIEVYDYTYYLDQYLSSYWQDEYHLWFMLCKIVPIIIFLVCLPFMKNLFVNQLALQRRA